MHVVWARNVNDALVKGVKLLSAMGQARVTRNGAATVAPWPVCTVYHRPTERVLLEPARADANPFFHLFEAVWMLGGRDDVAWLARFNKRMREYSDDGETFHAAYGHRWRHHFENPNVVGTNDLDQLAAVIKELRAHPESRRAVLAMWDPAVDLGRQGKDLPCNTHVYFRRAGDRLDMTTLCRSNDIIWGAYGANAVHLSVLHEYVAAALGDAVGTWWQFSNDYHAYVDKFEPLKLSLSEKFDGHKNQYVTMNLEPVPLVAPGETPADLMLDVALFLDDKPAYGYRTKFFGSTVGPMLAAWASYERRDDPERFAKAHSCARQVAAPDWRLAAEWWLAARELKTKRKQSNQGSMSV